MSVFEFLSVALSFVLGLAVTLLLTSLLAAFRARHSTKMDWLPFVWAGYALAYQFQYWWALFELSALPRWTVAMFGMLLLLAALLFVAGALVLPSGSRNYPVDLRAYFETDGRWGAAALAAYNLVAVLVNVVMFEMAITDRTTWVSLSLALTGGLVVVARSRNSRVILSLVFGALTLLGVALASPAAY